MGYFYSDSKTVIVCECKKSLALSFVVLQYEFPDSKPKHVGDKYVIM